MSDSSIRQDVLDELEFEPSIDANDIGVMVENGIVTLTGHVPTYSQKLAAERAVARIKGVRGIAQEIEVRHNLGQGTSDEEIAARVLETLKWSTVVPEGKITVKVERGWVTLSGKLDWFYQRAGAENAVRDLRGVTGITNNIVLKPRVSPLDVKKNLEDALRRSAELEADGIRVKVAGNKVTLEGRVKTWRDRRLAERAAWAASGVTAVEDHLTVG